MLWMTHLHPWRFHVCNYHAGLVVASRRFCFKVNSQAACGGHADVCDGGRLLCPKFGMAAV